jgi:hypothetical protein
MAQKLHLPAGKDHHARAWGSQAGNIYNLKQYLSRARAVFARLR